MKTSLPLRVSRIALLSCLILATALCSLVGRASAVTPPDGRVYEEVTPVHMNGARAAPVLVTGDGQQVLYTATGAFAGSPSGGLGGASYVAQRTFTGWQTYPMAPPSSQYFVNKIGGGPVTVSSDLTRAVFNLAPPFESYPGSGSTQPYLVSEPGAPTVSPVEDGAQTITYASRYGTSTDLSHLDFEEEGQVYEEYGVGSASQHSRLVGALGADDSQGGGKLLDACGTHLGSIVSLEEREDSHSVFHAVSQDGSTVFFTAPACKREGGVQEPGVDELYARVRGTTTVPISEPSVAACSTQDTVTKPIPSSCANALFEGASLDGSRVIFSSTQADEVPGGTDGTENLYEAELGSSSVTKMTQISAGDTSHEGARVQGVVRISDDGSHVYFVAQGVLTRVANAEGQVARNGADNLYAYAAGSIEFVGDLCSGFNASGTVADRQCQSSTNSDTSLWLGMEEGHGSGQYVDGARNRAWAAPFGSPASDGRFLAFDAYAQLTPGDTSTAEQVFEYDSQTGSLVRVSVGRAGFNNDGNTEVDNARIPTVDAGILGDQSDFELAPNPEGSEGGRPVSDDGSYVFFTTSDALVPEDVNNAPDVYEWHNGLVSLISDGQNPGTHGEEISPTERDANTFVGSSASGADVFFSTPDSMVTGGGASQFAIYDARIGGGFPAVSVPPPCTEDACQGSISATPSFPFPTSATFSSGGNIVAGAPAASPKPKKKPKRKKVGHKKARAKKARRSANNPKHLKGGK